MAINAVGLEPAVGFLHEFSNYQTKQSLVYDLEEPFRWLVDLSVTQAFESGALKLHDFYFTGDDYRYRFEAEARQRFIDLIRERFNSGVNYKGRALKWDTVIEQKTTELGYMLVNRGPSIDFTVPEPKLVRQDDRKLRARILSLSQLEAKQLGIGKSTLGHLRNGAHGARSFQIYRKVRARLEVS